MAKININFNSIKNFLSNFIKNLTWLFFAIFLIILVFEAFEVKNSADLALLANQQPAPVATQSEVRINFGAYNNIVTRIQNAQDFQPPGGIESNPFGIQGQ